MLTKKQAINDNKYICKVCQKEFEKTWSDEEALEETKELFGEKVLEQELAIVCDVCFHEIMKSFN